MGTPACMAPELVTDGEVGPWTDLYSLGVMAYELLAGRPPFHETEHGLALMLLHAKEPVPPLATVRPDLDADLAGWVDELLSKEPRERPRSAGAAAESLDEILISALGPRWRRGSRLQTIAGVAGDRQRGDAADRDTADARRRRVSARVAPRVAAIAIARSRRRARCGRRGSCSFLAPTRPRRKPRPRGSWPT